jgi:hypothetical protein
MFGKIEPQRPGMTLIFRAAGMWQAEIIKGRLESSGIPVLLDYESAGPVYGLTIDGLGEVRIFVAEEQAEDAKKLLEPENTGDLPAGSDDGS